jgi:hypothetical protein
MKYQANTMQEYDSKIHMILSRLEKDLTLKKKIFSIDVNQENGINFLILPNDFILTETNKSKKGNALYLSTYDNKELVIESIQKCEELHHGIKFHELIMKPSFPNQSPQMKEF